MPKLGFDPARHGFHFANRFTDQIGPFTTRGLCGGMTLAAFNYFRSGVAIPTHRPEDFGTADGVPPVNSRLRNYIFGQQVGSFASAAGFLFPTWFEPVDDILRRQFQASVADFDEVKRIVDRGHFVLLGLRTSEIGSLLGHQVLAYGYEESPSRLWVYDSNFPDQEMVLILDESAERLAHTHADGRRSVDVSRYGSFFPQIPLDASQTDLFTAPSRPPYADVCVRLPVAVSAPVGDGLRQVGEPLEVSATVVNAGDHPARVAQLLLFARDPRGRNRDDDLGVRDMTRVLAPGQQVSLHRSFDAFGDQEGFYRFGLAYLSEQGHWMSIPRQSPEGLSPSPEVRVELVAGIDGGRNFGTGEYAGPGVYQIRARHSGKVLDVNIDWFSGQDNGRPIAQVDNNGGDNQVFIVEPLPDGFVRLRAKHSGKVIDVEGGSIQSGARLHQWDWNGNHNQQFRIEPVADHYRVVARHSGKVFDIAGVSQENGARLTQWEWWAGSNQLFQFVPVHQ